MIRSELRIVFAAIAVFASLIGLYLVLDGLVFDAWAKFRYGAAALNLGFAGFSAAQSGPARSCVAGSARQHSALRIPAASRRFVQRGVLAGQTVSFRERYQ